MRGYWLILGTEIHDAAAQADYGRLWAPIAESYGARVIREPKATVLADRRGDTARMLIVEFPSIEAARQCYDDPAYREAARFAAQAASRDLLIIEGDLS